MKVTLKTLLAAGALITSIGSSHAQFSDYANGRVITLDGAQIQGSTPHTNFPVYLHFTDPSLKSIFYGGNVQSTDAEDLIFISSDCSVQFDHQLEKYDQITGEVAAWVKIPVLETNVDYEFFMLYGNASAVSTETEEVWSNGYTQVYHFDSLLDTTDMTGHGLDGYNFGTDPIAQGKLLEGRYYDAKTDYISIGTDLLSLNEGSFSVWAKPDSLDANMNLAQYLFGHTTQPAWQNRIQLYLNDVSPSGHLNVGFGNQHALAPSLDSLVEDEWKFVTLTWKGEGTLIFKLYTDGTLVGSDTVNGFQEYYPTADIGNNGEIGSTTAPHKQGFHGTLDEVHIASLERSGGWIATTYNNQNAPASFAALSTEQTYVDLCAASLTEHAKKEVLKIYPVPAHDQLVISLEDSKETILKVCLTDINGRVVRQLDASGKVVKLDVSGFSEGMYFVKIQTESSEMTKPVWVK